MAASTCGFASGVGLFIAPLDIAKDSKVDAIIEILSKCGAKSAQSQHFRLYFEQAASNR